MTADARTDPTIPTLLIDARQAAKALSVSPRTLWQRTKDGTIPAVRLGGLVRYDLDALREWIKGQANAAANN